MGFPEPEAGLVISYSYLWSDEAEAGHVEGRKNRPCAIVLVVQQSEDKAPVITVVPITHSPHGNPNAAVEIPPAVKRHLGLDDQPSWIVLDDFNVFTWPGYADPPSRHTFRLSRRNLPVHCPSKSGPLRTPFGRMRSSSARGLI
jgi:PemK-like, MazF-like toxin of type II toxin-antitoxin system